MGSIKNLCGGRNMQFGGCRQHSAPCQLLNDIFNGASEGLSDLWKINVYTTAEP